ncbi:hypothetical protein TRFO_28957 [Tritrichomonas foetus]|uniref:Uncharacterized protein n=1 Tax=Tritrichomonas foetus TaxID=1144522 RepID=A0A1J4JYS5_9EUKA|nr:hypothetical protein TRFO_28957 [Tritrichomonas foetus]|eukprot:OHT03632.1 hypothetical protein TRFO_28957 [Tritrichomonas foetus]
MQADNVNKFQRRKRMPPPPLITDSMRINCPITSDPNAHTDKNSGKDSNIDENFRMKRHEKPVINKRRKPFEDESDDIIISDNKSKNSDISLSSKSTHKPSSIENTTQDDKTPNYQYEEEEDEEGMGEMEEINPQIVIASIQDSKASEDSKFISQKFENKHEKLKNKHEVTRIDRHENKREKKYEEKQRNNHEQKFDEHQKERGKNDNIEKVNNLCEKSSEKVGNELSILYAEVPRPLPMFDEGDHDPIFEEIRIQYMSKRKHFNEKTSHSNERYKRSVESSPKNRNIVEKNNNESPKKTRRPPPPLDF